MTIIIRTKLLFSRGDGCLKHVIALERLYVYYSSGKSSGDLRCLCQIDLQMVVTVCLTVQTEVL